MAGGEPRGRHRVAAPGRRNRKLEHSEARAMPSSLGLVQRGLLTYRTLRPLPTRQVGHLLWARCVGRHLACRYHVPPHPAVEPGFAFRVSPMPLHRCVSHTADIAVNRYTFMNHAASFGPRITWDDPALPLLWRCNLHYFDYLWSVQWPEAERLMTAWVLANPCPASRSWPPTSRPA